MFDVTGFAFFGNFNVLEGVNCVIVNVDSVEKGRRGRAMGDKSPLHCFWDDTVGITFQSIKQCLSAISK